VQEGGRREQEGEQEGVHEEGREKQTPKVHRKEDATEAERFQQTQECEGVRANAESKDNRTK
jgi:hypothetical protein